MPGDVIGTRYVEVRAKTDQFKPDAAKAAEEAGTQAGQSFGEAFKSKAGAIGATMSKAVTLPIVGGFYAAFREIDEAGRVGSQTTAVLKSTGEAAGVSQKQVEGLAGALSKKAGIDDEVIQSGENMLLTFRSIRNETGKGNDIFTRATKVALDMSVAFGTDLQGSVIQVGKALQDPITGLTALRRVGVSFTQQQQDQIKALTESGHLLDAQKIILKELQTEFGGSAAAGKTAFGSIKVDLGNMAEQAGKVALPAVKALGAGVSVLAKGFADIPDWGAVFLVGGAAALAATGPILSFYAKFQTVRDGLAKAAEESTGFGAKFAGLGSTALTVGSKLAVGAAGAYALSGALQQVGVGAEAAELASATLAGFMVGGPWGAAIGAGISLSKSLAQGIFAAGESADQTRSRLASLANDLNRLTSQDAARKFMESFADNALNGRVKSLSDEIQKLAEASPAAARRVVDGMSAIGSSDKEVAKLQAAVARGTNSFREHEMAAASAAKKNRDLAGTNVDLGDSFDDTTDAADKFKAKIDEIAGVSLDVESANLRLAKSNDQLGKSLDENGRTLDANTIKGRENRQALLDTTQAALAMAEAQVKQTHDTAGANETLQRHREYLVDVMRQSGLTEEQIQQYLRTLGLTPEQVSTYMQALTGDADKAIDETQWKVKKLGEGTVIPIGWTVDDPPEWAKKLLPKFDTGGLVDAPKGTQVPAIVHGGEYVLSADVVDRIRQGAPSAGASVSNAAQSSTAGAAGPSVGMAFYGPVTFGSEGAAADVDFWARTRGAMAGV